jgi:hypothetical protein
MILSNSQTKKNTYRDEKKHVEKSWNSEQIEGIQDLQKIL